MSKEKHPSGELKTLRASVLEAVFGTFPASLDEWVLVALLVALCLQNMVILETPVGTIRPYHVIGVIAFLYVLVVSFRSRKGIASPPLGLVAVVAIFTAVSLYNMPQYGLDTITLNYIFVLMVAATVQNLIGDTEPERIRSLVIAGATFVLFMVIITALANWKAIAAYLVYGWDGHPDYQTVFQGGVNIEVSWLALLGTCFRNDLRGRVYLLTTLVFSLVVSSRAGLMLVVLAALYVAFSSGGHAGGLVRRALLPVAVILIVALTAAVALGLPVVERLLSIGEDGGSLGRLSIWKYSLEVFAGVPLLGVGGGNAMDSVRALSNYAFAEDNVHNLYLQVLVDYGLVGAISFATLLLKFVIECIKTRLANPFAAFLALYLIGALLQFRGGDPLLGMAVGCYLAYRCDISRASSEGAL